MERNEKDRRKQPLPQNKFLVTALQTSNNHYLFARNIIPAIEIKRDIFRHVKGSRAISPRDSLLGRVCVWSVKPNL